MVYNTHKGGGQLQNIEDRQNKWHHPLTKCFTWPTVLSQIFNPNNYRNQFATRKQLPCMIHLDTISSSDNITTRVHKRLDYAFEFKQLFHIQLSTQLGGHMYSIKDLLT